MGADCCDDSVRIQSSRPVNYRRQPNHLGTKADGLLPNCPLHLYISSAACVFILVGIASAAGPIIEPFGAADRAAAIALFEVQKDGSYGR
jgi:hypothetical protein